MRKLITTLGILSASLFTSFGQVKEFSKPSDQYFEIAKNLEIFTNIFKELNTYYVNPIEPGKMTQTAINAMLEELDPYTNFFTESQREDFELLSKGKYAGIGVSLIYLDSTYFIRKITENGPAFKAGIKPGDEIISINEVPVRKKSLDEIGLLMDGAPGTNIVLEIKNPKESQPQSVTIRREAIDGESKPIYRLLGANKDVAYVYFSQFTGGCSDKVRKALDEMKAQQPNLSGVILDLRGNPGGLLHEAVNICNLFLPKNTLIVTVRGRNRKDDVAHYTQNAAWDEKIPVVVLINNESASASEVVAGTLQDLDRGVIVGTKSFGKGLVQVFRDLGYNTSLKLTVSKYYTPSGRCIQAIDYAHRNPDGSVSSIPDSLKKAFTTQNGRVVYEGGGIDPDIVVKDEDVNRTLIMLMTNGQIFDYVTDYYYKHPSIPAPEEFYITDADYKEFLSFVDKRAYDDRSISEMIVESLESTLAAEKHLEESRAALDQLKASIKESKKKMLERSEHFLKDIISAEIVSRYYYENGRIAHRLHHSDQELDKALDVLSKPQDKYYPLLQKK